MQIPSNTGAYRENIPANNKFIEYVNHHLFDVQKYTKWAGIVGTTAVITSLIIPSPTMALATLITGLFLCVFSCSFFILSSLRPEPAKYAFSEKAVSYEKTTLALTTSPFPGGNSADSLHLGKYKIGETSLNNDIFIDNLFPLLEKEPSIGTIEQQQNGFATVTLAKGSLTYEGGIKEGYFNGQGTLNLPNGKTYKGIWRSGYLWHNALPNSTVKEGVWDSGYLVHCTEGYVENPALKTPSNQLNIVLPSEDYIKVFGVIFFINLGNITFARFDKEENVIIAENIQSFLAKGENFSIKLPKQPTQEGDTFIAISGPAILQSSLGTLECQYDRGIIQGKGKLTLCNGTTYEGNFSGGKFDGLGKLTLTENDKYEGNWSLGKLTL